MKRTNQGGSILSFVIIGGVMILLLVGGAYVVRHTLTPKENTGTPVAQKDKNSSSGDKQEQPSTDSSKSKDDTAAKTDDKTNAPSPNQTGTPSPSVDTAPDTHALPATGPPRAFLNGTMLSGLVAAVAMYVRSRRDAASL